MENKTKIEKIFIKNRLVKLLKRLKELHIQRIDGDIDRVLDDVPAFEALTTMDNDIYEETKKISSEIKVLMLCDSKGINSTIEDLLTEAKEKISYEEYIELETLASKIISDCEKEYTEATDVEAC